jgi:hypothetical protein
MGYESLLKCQRPSLLVKQILRIDNAALVHICRPPPSGD